MTRNGTFSAIVLACLLLLSGCAGPDDGSGLDVKDGGGATTGTGGSGGSASTAPPASSGGSDTGVLRGLVEDDEAFPIEGASVILFGGGAEGQDVKRSTTADGRFVFNSVPEGQYRVVADAAGHGSESLQVQVIGGQTKDVTFTLEPQTVVDPRPDYYADASGHIQGPVWQWEDYGGSGNGEMIEFPVEQWPDGFGFVNLTWNQQTPTNIGGAPTDNYLNLAILDAEDVEIARCTQGNEHHCQIASFPTSGTYKAHVFAWSGYDIDWEMTIFVPYKGPE